MALLDRSGRAATQEAVKAGGSFFQVTARLWRRNVSKPSVFSRGHCGQSGKRSSFINAVMFTAIVKGGNHKQKVIGP